MMLMLLLGVGGLQAKPRLQASTLVPDDFHFMGIWGRAAYSTLLNPSNVVVPAPGFSPAIGVGYRMYHNHFILNVGVEGQYSYLTNGVSDGGVEIPMIDTEDDPFIMHAYLGDCKDVVRSAFINVPLHIGGEYDRFYAMIGATFQCQLFGNTESRSMLTTTATYDRFMEDFHSMDNHLLVDDKLVSSGNRPLKLNVNLLLDAEIGVRVDRFLWKKGYDVHNHSYRIYLGAFVQYGLLNIHQPIAEGSILSFEQTESEGVKFFVMPAMLCNELVQTPFYNLNVGLKLSAFFELPKDRNGMIYDAHGAKKYHRVAQKSQAVWY